MRFKGYWRKLIGEDTDPVFVLFHGNDFREVGISSTLGEMPLLESYELVNRWNAATGKHGGNRSIYWLEGK